MEKEEQIQRKIQAYGCKSLEEVVFKLQRDYFGPRYVGATLSELEIPDGIARVAAQFMKTPKNMLIYYGSPGCGKTRFLASLMEWAFITFGSFRKYRELDLLSKLRDKMNPGESDYSIILNEMTDDDLIILDDVGSGINPSKITYKDLEWRREILFNFLDNRYNTMKPTIITSNFNKREFDEVYSERISSRLFAQENMFMPLFGDGIDQRQKGR